MNIAHAKAIPMSEILARIGHDPSRISNGKLFYFSPFRAEKTPSFVVYLNSNSWYDFGEGCGGDAVGFVQYYLKCTKEDHNPVDALRWIKNMVGGNIKHSYSPPPERFKTKAGSPLSIRSIGPIRHIALIRYLEQRGISSDIARGHLEEIVVENSETGKSFFALGFKNEDGGYELRNPFFKGSTSPKTFTFIRAGSYPVEQIHIFEGFMDYLSVVTRLGYSYLAGDSIVLNSVGTLPGAFPFIKDYGYKVACSWLDNDKAGDKASRLLSEFINSQNDMRYTRMNKMYAPYKDVNEWHMHTLQEVHYD